MPDFLPRQRWPLASCQTGTDDLPTRFGPNVRRWGTGGSQTHPWREMDSNFQSPVSGETLGLEARHGAQSNLAGPELGFDISDLPDSNAWSLAFDV
jgi:hypothetical protein